MNKSGRANTNNSMADNREQIMKVEEALEILKQLDPKSEVELRFPNKSYTDRRETESDHPCGVRYETQAERFGRQ